MTQLFADAYGRANGGLGANYAQAPGEGVLALVANAVTLSADGLDDAAYVLPSVAAPGNDQWASAQIQTLANANASPGLLVRCSTTLSTFYYCIINGPFGAAVSLSLNKSVAGAAAGMTSGLITLASGNRVTLWAIGTTIFVTIGNSSTPVLSTTDSSIAGGQFGIIVQNNGQLASDQAIINFTGGDTSPGPESLILKAQVNALLVN